MTKPPKLNLKAPQFDDLCRILIDEAIVESRRIAFDAAIDLCADIAGMNGSAADCVTALNALQFHISADEGKEDSDVH